MEKIKKNSIVYYAQCLEPVGEFEVLELKVRTVKSNWYVGIEKKDKHSYLFYDHDIGKRIFFDRNEALDVVKEAEKKYKKKYSEEKSETLETN